MEKVRIVALEDERYKVIAALHNVGVIDIRKGSADLPDDSPSNDFPVLSDLLVKYSGAEHMLESGLGRKELLALRRVRQRPANLATVVDSANAHMDIVNRVYAIEERLGSIKSELEEIERAKVTIALFMGSGIDFSKLSSSVLSFSAYRVARRAERAVEKMAGNLGEGFEVKEITTKGALTVFIAYKRENAERVEPLRSINGVNEIDIRNPYFDSTPQAIAEKLDRLSAKLKGEEKQKEAELVSIAKHELPKLVAVRGMLEIEAERAGVSMSFKKTDKTFVVEGWIPVKKYRVLYAALKGAVNERFALRELHTSELAPTLMSRPKWLRPFDYLMEFYSMPRSDEIDPTWIFIISFPIFYGLMVSDVGYGIASFLLATWITKITNPEGLMYNAAKVWQICAISAVFFGFLTNEYFGIPLDQHFIGFAGISWFKNIIPLLVITIFFGVAQVSIGLLFSFINNYRHGHKRLAVSKLASILFIISGIFAVGGALFGLFGATVTDISAVISFAAIGAMIALSSSEAAEITQLLSHLISYARIMGFGLASVIIAMLIDQAFLPHLSSGIIAFVAFLLIFILLHFLNMILAIFEGLVQGVRLNFVEFFSKFYTGGGEKFRPFYYKRNYTKEE
ncbi:MAG: V-type ATP synthase subunit I [Candidatus Micrarchaeia archaeon]